MRKEALSKSTLLNDSTPPVNNRFSFRTLSPPQLLLLDQNLGITPC